MGDTFARRGRFIEHVTSLLIDDQMKSVALRLLMAVPSAFWSAPASSSGKYHPSYALGDGGLLRHTLVCIHVARDLANAYGYTPDADWQMDAIVFAAAFHDTYKGGDTGIEPWTETLKEHPKLAAAQIAAASMHEERTTAQTLRLASDAVRLHMSMWGPHAEPIDHIYVLGQIVATADYIASRKYLEPSAELAELLARFE